MDNLWTYGLFPLFGYLNNTVLSVMYKLLCRREFSVPLGVYLGAGLLCHRAALFVRNCQTVYKSGQQFLRLLISPHSYQYVLFTVLSILAHLAGVKRRLTVV